MNVNFEKKNKEVLKLSSTITYIGKTAKTKQEAVNRLSEVLSNKIKIGFGGSHVWAANEKNERIFIIFF